MFVGAFDRSGIVEAPVNLFRAGGESGATSLGVVANGDYVVEALARKFVNAFRSLARNVHAELLHDGNSLRPHLRGSGSGAEYIEAIAGVVPQQAFGHLAAS